MNLSHKFTELGLLERENASVLNASLQPLADEIVPAFMKLWQVAQICSNFMLVHVLVLMNLSVEEPECWHGCAAIPKSIIR